MKITYSRALGAASLLAACFGTIGGCSEAEQAPPNFGTPTWGGGAGMSADASGSGSGGGGTSGAAGSSGGSAGGDGGNPLSGSTITACPGASSLDPSAFKACPLCAGARCVPASAVPAGQGDILADCGGDGGASDSGTGEKCVPDAYVSVLGKFLAKTCRSLLDAEGRCISTCVPQVAGQKDQLPSMGCAAEERCAPCYNPIDGTPTGACTTGCDTGPKEDAKKFAECGDGRGVCVPQALVPADLLMSVPQATCPMGELCAPKEKARDQSFKFPTCDPPPILLLIDPPIGACVPKYIVKPDQAGLLVQHTCGAGELCAPCVNPLDMLETGACK